VLSPAMRVLSFDNRGAGRSDAPPGPYTLAEMASDAIAVLDAEGIQRAHVCGFSLGGMVAQELALRYPERVARLVLGARTAGGPGGLRPCRVGGCGWSGGGGRPAGGGRAVGGGRGGGAGGGGGAAGGAPAPTAPPPPAAPAAGRAGRPTAPPCGAPPFTPSL